jgi:ribosomal protein L24
MTPTSLIVGDKVKVVGGTYAGYSAVVLKVTKHMVQLQLLRRNVVNGNELLNQVWVMKWNVEKASSSSGIESSSSPLVAELEALRDQIDAMLQLFGKLNVINGDD